MSLDITVRGSAEKRFPAERATASMAVVIEGTDKERVFAEAVGVQEPLVAQLQDLRDRESLLAWSCDQVRVSSHRPYAPDGSRQQLVHVARIEVGAVFSDFDQLSTFLDQWSGREGVEVAQIAWDVGEEHRRSHEADVRSAAVTDAVRKAQAFADAVGAGAVTALHLADPGMLGDVGGSPGTPMFARMSSDVGSGPALNLTPDEIVIHIEVDARFTAQ